jgi:hypothetical protein
VNELKFGDRVRVKCGATGRYLGRYGLALVVSTQDHDLFVDYVDPDGEPPHPTLPVPSSDALSGASAVLWSSKFGGAK